MPSSSLSARFEGFAESTRLPKRSPLQLNRSTGRENLTDSECAGAMQKKYVVGLVVRTIILLLGVALNTAPRLAYQEQFNMTTLADPIVGQIAQTNLQLFQQMCSNGYSVAELGTVADAYRTATKLFANRFRSCGRPFVAHLVGTGAVLVWLKAPVPLVVAALSHASYQEGDFPNSLEGMTPRKRKKLRAAIGTEAETLVAAYTLSSRSVTGLKASHARFKDMSSAERDVLLIQLANELDDYRDLAANYASNANERIEAIRQSSQLQAELAEWLGQPKLARALRETYADSIAASVAASLVSSFPDAYLIVPNSCRVRLNILARRLAVKIKNRLRRHLGVG